MNRALGVGLLVGSCMCSNAQWSLVGDGLSGEVGALQYDSIHQRIYAVGHFSMAGDLVVNGTAYWDGFSWHALGQGVDNPQALPVMAALLMGDSLLISGSFQNIEGVEGSRATALWDGSQWRSIGPGGSYGRARGMVSNEDGITLAGSLDSIAGIDVNRIARYQNGTWSSICAYPTDQGFVSYTSIVKYQGQYIFGGNINVPGLREIGYLDGDTLRQLGPGINGDPWVNDMVIYQDDLFVGGEFYAAWGNAASGLMKWDGSAFSDPFPGAQYIDMVHDMDVRNGELYISGRVVVPGTSGYYRLARFNGEQLCLFGKDLNVVFRDIAATGTELFVAPNAAIPILYGDTLNTILRYDLSYPPDTCITIQTGLHEITPHSDGWTFAPIPFQDRLTIRSRSSIPRGSVLQFFDAMGRLVWTKSLAFTSPNTRLDVMLPSLSAGTLQARIIDEYGVVLTWKTLVTLGN